MQICASTDNSFPLPNLTVAVDVYYICFPKDYWRIKFTGKFGNVLHAAVTMNSAQYMACISSTLCRPCLPPRAHGVHCVRGGATHRHLYIRSEEHTSELQ